MNIIPAAMKQFSGWDSFIEKCQKLGAMMSVSSIVAGDKITIFNGLFSADAQDLTLCGFPI
jgi:hypothetical protein